VVAAADLAEGISHVADQVGVAPETGGRHARYGTHNALLSLGPDAYLEVIAVDPQAPPPSLPRWFALDSTDLTERLRAGPTLVHWVAALDVLDGVGPEHGEPVQLSRGDNRWTLTVPPDGSLPMGGVLPSLITWHTDPPATRLPDRGIRLRQLALATPEPGLLTARLAALGLGGDVTVIEAPKPSLRAIVRSPAGLAAL
jgi:glyoxalase-like protein